jgi:long-chain acyl-CoA synthetase
MDNKMMLTIPFLAGESFRKHGSNKAMGFVGEDVITYHQLSNRTRAITRLLEEYRVQKGDRVALLSGSMPNWGATYLAITSMGAVAVPILPDFTAGEVSNVMVHSGAKVLFVSNALRPKIEGFKSETLETVISNDDFSVISGSNGASFDPEGRPEREYPVEEEDLAVIIYTSGTQASLRE